MIEPEPDKPSEYILLEEKHTQVGKILRVAKRVKSVKVGDRIVYQKYHDARLTFGDEKHQLLLVEEQDVVALL